MYFSATLLKTDLVWCKTHSDAEPIVFFSSVTAKSRSSASCWQSSHFLSWLYSKAFCNNNFPLGINKGNSDSDQSTEVLKITTKTVTLHQHWLHITYLPFPGNPHGPLQKPSGVPKPAIDKHCYHIVSALWANSYHMSVTARSVGGWTCLWCKWEAIVAGCPGRWKSFRNFRAGLLTKLVWGVYVQLAISSSNIFILKCVKTVAKLRNYTTRLILSFLWLHISSPSILPGALLFSLL